MVLRCFLILVVSLLLSHALASAGITELVSVSDSGEPGNDVSHRARISADGRFVAFESFAGNFGPPDSNSERDVYLRDRQAGVTELISVSLTGSAAEGYEPAMSADGRYVAFYSCSGNMAKADSNGFPDIFVRDRLTGVTELVSVSSSGAPANSCSGFVGGMSADGRFVVFGSNASNLVAGDNNGVDDIFVRDRVLGTTVLASISSTGEQANASGGVCDVSDDGRFVAFHTDASNLVPGHTPGTWDVFVHDGLDGTTVCASVDLAGTPAGGGFPDISGNGRFVSFHSSAENLVVGDTNGVSDVFLRDLQTSTTELVSVSSDGQQGNANSSCSYCSMSADGRFVVFISGADNLVSGDTNGVHDVFLRDRQEGTTERVSLAAYGEEAGAESTGSATVTNDGRYVAFSSDARNLVPSADVNATPQVYLRDRQTFADVPVGFWAFCATEACVSAGVVSGYEDGTYQPGNAVTRGQMAVYVSRSLAGGDENVPEFTETPTFPDVPEGSWALKYVEYAVSQNVVGGYVDGTYHPEDEVTRDQMAVYIARALVAPEGDDGLADYVPAGPRNFPDVPTDHWAYTHIEYCVENGVVAGYLDGLYHPEIVVTRDQMAVYVARAFGLTL